MRVMAALVVIAIVATSPALAQDDLRFAAVDIYLDSPEPIAAWQFELGDKHGLMRVVGVENGESPAYRRSPYYDREAVRLGAADRIVVADYSLEDIAELPSGRVRIATVHLMLGGAADADFELILKMAATHDGRAIDAKISLDANAGSKE